ncbi:MAG: hypothetical protein ABJL99_24955 [Aliishimia sp.]
MLWLVALVTVLPLMFFLADLDWTDETAPGDMNWDDTSSDLLTQVMQAGSQAEPVWGAWLRVTDFDPVSDVLVIETASDEDVIVTHSASADGDTYLMLSDGTRIVLDRLAKLPCPAEDIVFFLQA